MTTQPHATEGQEQAALFDFFARIAPRVPAVAWACHVPNGGPRVTAVAVPLARPGVRAGVPDLRLPIRRAPFVGLVIELKVGKNTPTPAQRLWLAHLAREGWQTAVCWGWEDAARAALGYLGEDLREYGL